MKTKLTKDIITGKYCHRIGQIITQFINIINNDQRMKEKIIYREWSMKISIGGLILIIVKSFTNYIDNEM